MAVDLFPSIYTLWLVTSSTSIFLSILMLISILRQPKSWGKMFHQMSAILALFDLVFACPTLLDKSNQSDAICSFQEYMLQCGLLGKACVTVVICYVSMRTIRDMESQSTKFLFSFLGIVLFGAAICLGLSVYFDTASVWCGGHEWEKLSSSLNAKEMVYLMTVSAPLSICVVFNTYCFFSIMSRINSQERSDSSSVNSTSSNESKLYRVVRHIIFYPIVVVIAFIPEAVALTYSLITGKFSRTLYSIATIFLGLNGAAVAVNFFRQQKLHPNLQKITFGFRNHPIFHLGRHLPSVMSLFSNDSTIATDSSSSPTTRNPVLQGSGDFTSDSGISLNESSYNNYESSTSSATTAPPGTRYSTQFESDSTRNSEDSSFGGYTDRRFPVF